MSDYVCECGCWCAVPRQKPDGICSDCLEGHHTPDFYTWAEGSEPGKPKRVNRRLRPGEFATKE